MYRGLLADSLSPLAPFGTVLEIGCHSGPNLWALRQRWPHSHLIGVDPGDKTIMYGAAMCELGIQKGDHLDNIDFYHGSAPAVLTDAEHLRAWGPVDVIVSCYTLAYLHEVELGLTLDAMLKVARKGLVLCEPMPINGAVTSELIERSHKVPSWRHPYVDRVAALAPSAKLTSRRFPGPDALDGILVVRKL